MDGFVKRFYPEHEAPGIEFKSEGDLKFGTYYGGVLRVFDGHVQSSRNHYAVQEMTAAGKLKAVLMGTSSSLDGLTKQYLTPEGMVNISTVAEALKQSAGLQTQVWSTHVNRMQHWGWADNHVSLLVNLLRFSILLRTQESNGGNLDCSLGVYMDGHVNVDMDQWWSSEYPEKYKMDTWPTGTGEENYPEYAHLTSTTPDTDSNAIDLRGLTAVEANIILMMTGAWSRKSRCRLDFSTPRLTELLYYRHGSTMTGLESWLKEEQGAEMPKMPNWKQVWSALRAYVGQNRLYDQFSTALYIVSFLAYQFVPATAEACVWLSFDWQIVMPVFHSIRGRYEILNDGEAALVSHRAINEWGFINGKLEKINLMCMLVAQCFQTGCAVRAMRKGLETDPHDLYSTETEFYSASSFMSAAVSEATRSEFPMPGMAGIYLRTDVRFDDPGEFQIMTLNTSERGLEGYDTEVIESKTKEIKKVHKELSDLEGKEKYAEALAEISMLKQIAEIKLQMKSSTLSYQEKLAVENKYVVETEVETTVNLIAVKCVWVPMAGSPVLALPLNPFPYNSPLTLKGTIEPAMGSLSRKGFKVSADKAWLIANFTRLCGYDVLFKQHGEQAGPSDYFAPNNVNMVWPILATDDDQDEPITITGMEERDRLFVSLPPIHNKFFSNQKLEYAIQINRKGVCIYYDAERSDITEYGGVVKIAKDINVTINTGETVQRLRGYITREETGFRFVGGVQAGVIPPQQLDQGVPAAGED
ncbi:hypothetical protein 1 [Hubei toti-like virus 2]|uniref:Major coat protein L-A virus domain-containing protein n=1 Tax=Hubei toti-like virus 2 TaxID=1923308 RepID=A0A1L3KEZ0_9VIRU|nr:hypothetical protein 1 [Hubei toti-like virus 2]APG75975.1 hypothetical protein 1 [Hubei toti-like virus 2]